MPLDFYGKVAFVTGAGSIGEGWGNGKATSVLLARQGAKVFGTDINPEALTDTGSAMARENLSGHWSSCQCDATSGKSVEAAVARCVRELGRIDILVNNVGGSAPGDPITMSEEVWEKQVALNLDSVFLNCKHVLPVMLRQFEEGGSGGAIVNIGSVGSMTFQMGGRVSAAYAASKAAVEAFSRSTAIAFAKKGIRVNTVVPGSMHTPLVENRLARQLGKDDVARLIAERNASVPMGRMGDAWDVANAVLFLASDEARYITATQLVVDGGLTAARPA